MMDDITMLECDEAYQAEFAKWSSRFNKSTSPPRFEIIRVDVDPVVMCSTTGEHTAQNELEERRAIASMRAAFTVWRNAPP